MLVSVEHRSQNRSLVQPTSDKHHLPAMDTGTLYAWEVYSLVFDCEHDSSKDVCSNVGISFITTTTTTTVVIV